MLAIAVQFQQGLIVVVTVVVSIVVTQYYCYKLIRFIDTQNNRFYYPFLNKSRFNCIWGVKNCR